MIYFFCFDQDTKGQDSKGKVGVKETKPKAKAEGKTLPKKKTKPVEKKEETVEPRETEPLPKKSPKPKKPVAKRPSTKRTVAESACEPEAEGDASEGPRKKPATALEVQGTPKVTNPYYYKHDNTYGIKLNGKQVILATCHHFLKLMWCHNKDQSCSSCLTVFVFRSADMFTHERRVLRLQCLLGSCWCYLCVVPLFGCC